MTCREFQAHVTPYVDGELGVDQTAAAHAHLAECHGCGGLVERQRRFRSLLRRQPRERAPAEFRARLAARCRLKARWRRGQPWLAASGVVAAAGLMASLWLPALRAPSPLLSQLVGTHIAYAQINAPAEFASDDPIQLAAWFQERAGFRVALPDYSPGGIRLVGGRLADIEERCIAYVIYAKGHALMSIFILPATSRPTALSGRPVAYRGREYVTEDLKGYHTVSWTENRVVHGLVSTLDYDALLECAERLREMRARETPL